MDAINKADFINSVASGNNVPCPNCGTSNGADSNFCIACGTKLAAIKEVVNNAPAFEPAKEAFAPVAEEAEPAKEAFAPVAEEAEPAKEAFAPVVEQVKLAKEAFASVKEAFQPAQETAEPVKEAFQPVNEEIVPVKKTVAPAIGKYVEPSCVFAQGLPEWSIEPPQVMVRRH